MDEKFKIRGIPDSIYYIPDFISEEEEKLLLLRISQTSKVKWTQLSHRRLQNWGGLPNKRGMILETMPDWLETVVTKVNLVPGIFDHRKDIRANHVLLNEYNPGVGIMPHLDGDLFYPTITTVSLGSSTVIRFYREDENNRRQNIGSVLLEPRSLFVVKDEMYTRYLHGIDDSYEDIIDDSIINDGSRKYERGTVLKRDVRISLTIRHVPNTIKFSIFGKNKKKN